MIAEPLNFPDPLVYPIVFAPDYSLEVYDELLMPAPSSSSTSSSSSSSSSSTSSSSSSSPGDTYFTTFLVANWGSLSGGLYPITFTHGLNTANLLVEVWDTTSTPIQIIPDAIEETTLNSLTIRSGSKFNGRIVIFASDYMAVFNSGADWGTASGGKYSMGFVHGLNSYDLAVEAWNTAATPVQIIPSVIEKTDSNTLYLRVGQSPDGRFAGRVAVRSKRQYELIFDATTSWGSPSGGLYSLPVTHNLNSNNLLVEVWNNASSGAQIIPQIIQETSSNLLTIKVSQTPDGRFGGRVVISKA